jgi:hypothetical protein
MHFLPSLEYQSPNSARRAQMATLGVYFLLIKNMIHMKSSGQKRTEDLCLQTVGALTLAFLSSPSRLRSSVSQVRKLLSMLLIVSLPVGLSK